METFQVVTDQDLLKATLFHRSRLDPKTGCWVWKKKCRNGYGLMYLNSKTVSAHRVSYEVFKGAIPEAAVICHSCDNPACINPEHLRAGSMKENMADREARNRRDVRGEQVGTSKLTVEQVIDIKTSTMGQKFLAEKYGIAPSHVWVIRSGKAWKHLNAIANTLMENLNGH